MIKSINEIGLSGKKVLLRADLNLPKLNNQILDNTRLIKTLPIIKYLLEQKAKVILISHYGRPDGKFVSEMSLEFIVAALKDYLPDVEIKFIKDIYSEDSNQQISSLDEGQIVLIENLRFYPQEEANDQEFAKKLASFADIYVNEAFSCSHRSHASIDAITNYLPSYGGFLLVEEVNILNNIFSSSYKNTTAIVGGSKISSKIELLNSLTTKINNLVIGGAMANSFLKVMGYKIGKSLYEDNMDNIVQSIQESAKQNNCKILLPVDAVVAEDLTYRKNLKIVSIDKIEENSSIFDIGPKTTSIFLEALQNSSMVIWNGPLGAFEHSPFNLGTANLALNIASLTNSRKLISVAGGGDIVAAINNLNISKSFSYLSTAGGAFLEWLEGKKLPGILALENA